MNAPPALLALVIPAGLFAAWLFLHKDADVEQRIDKREAVHQRESAEFDRDFARLTGDKEGEKKATERASHAEEKLKTAEAVRDARGQTDQRAAVRDGVDQFLKPKPKDKGQEQ